MSIILLYTGCTDDTGYIPTTPVNMPGFRSHEALISFVVARLGSIVAAMPQTVRKNCHVIPLKPLQLAFTHVWRSKRPSRIGHLHVSGTLRSSNARRCWAPPTVSTPRISTNPSSRRAPRSGPRAPRSDDHGEVLSFWVRGSAAGAFSRFVRDREREREPRMRPGRIWKG